MSYNVYGAAAAQAQVERLERAKQAAKVLDEIKKNLPNLTENEQLKILEVAFGK